MTKDRRIISPLLLFVVVLAVFEFTVRLPYVLYATDAPALGADAVVHFFGYAEPARVISLGLTIVVAATLATFIAFAVSGPLHHVSSDRQQAPLVHWSIYLIAPVFVAAAVLAVVSLGAEALIEDLSGKRSELGERGLTWVLLRLAVFCHLIAAIFYIRVVQTGSLFDKLMFLVVVLAVIGPAVVFSQRAILISFVLEIIYLQLILGTFNIRRFLRLAAFILPALILISALRPNAELTSLSDALLFGVEKAVQSRYFLDFAKIGAVMSWAELQPWMGPIVFGFIFEPFLGDQIIFYKETGPIIAEQVYLYRAQNGVTPGFLLESILSFGIPLGIMLFAAVMTAFLRIEKQMLQARSMTLGGLLFRLLIVSKVSLLLNSSLGAFSFQLVTEAVLLGAVVLFISIMGSLGARAHLHRVRHA